jgi:hypothetical protein
MKYVMCLPYIYKPYADACINSMDAELRNNLLAIDNTIDNKGVAKSWNLGIDKVREENADWLIVISAAMRFGNSGGKDMIIWLNYRPAAQVIHFAEKQTSEQRYVRGMSPDGIHGISPGYQDGMFGWHCTALRRDVIDMVGYFDPNTFEDLDYDLRINKAFPAIFWVILPIIAHSESLNHGIRLGNAKMPSANSQVTYFIDKWGAGGSDWSNGWQNLTFDHPFNNPENSLTHILSDKEHGND